MLFIHQSRRVSCTEKYFDERTEKVDSLTSFKLKHTTYFLWGRMAKIFIKLGKVLQVDKVDSVPGSTHLKKCTKFYKSKKVLCVCDLINMFPIRRRTNSERRTRNATNQINYHSNYTSRVRKDHNLRERIGLKQTREVRYSTNDSLSLNRTPFCYDFII